jgi:hypothetical protein
MKKDEVIEIAIQAGWSKEYLATGDDKGAQ